VLELAVAALRRVSGATAAIPRKRCASRSRSPSRASIRILVGRPSDSIIDNIFDTMLTTTISRAR
jgi:hypothetical protein